MSEKIENQNSNPITCKNCGSTHVTKFGKYKDTPDRFLFSEEG